MATQNAGSPTRQRTLILAVLLGLAAVSWVVVIWQARTMQSPMMGAPMGLTMGMSAALFLAVWVAMMVAMMFPAAAPIVLMFSAIAAGKRERAQTYVPTWVFVCGYLIVWTLAGAAAYLLALGLDELAARLPWLMANAGRIGGVLLVAAGLYQLSPLKHICLAKCRTPMQFLMTSWHDGYGGALRMGIEHGVFCLGCCWLLFVILFPLGMMNIAVLALLTALIFAEKVLPFGRRVSTVAGVALVAYGALMVFVPTLLPTAVPMA